MRRPRHRHFLTGLGAIAVALSITAAVPSVAFADDVLVRASPHEGYGRIVFNWPAPVPFTARISGSDLVVRFQRDVEADFSAIPRSFRRYVGQPAISDDRRTVTFPLTRAFGLRAFPLGRAVIVDLIDDATTVADAGTTPSPAPVQRAGQAINVRTGEHPTFGRVVFDWPERVPYAVEQNGAEVTIRFDRSADVGAASIARGLKNVRKSSSRVDGTETMVDLEVTAGSKVRHFRNGSKVVIDVLRPEPAVAQAPPVKLVPREKQPPQSTVAKPDAQVERAPPPEKSAEQAKDVAQISEDQPPAVSEEPAPMANSEVPEQAPKPLALVPRTSPDEPPKKDEAPKTDGDAPEAVAQDGTSESDQGMSQADKQDASKAAATASPSPDAVPARRARPAAGTFGVGAVTLRVDWTEPAAAAVFRRGDYVWVVFDRDQALDTTALAAAGAPVIWAVDRIPSKRGLVLRFATSVGTNATVRRDGLSWVLDFAQQPQGSAAAIDVRPQPDSTGGPRIFIPIEEAAGPLAVTDPEVGDNLIVVPVAELGRGIQSPYQYPQLTILPTTQGIVLRPRSDDVRVRSAEQGVEISAIGRLLMSPLAAPPEEIVEPKLGSVQTVSRVVPPTIWRKARHEGLSKFRETKNELLSRAAYGGEADRQAGRYDLATFFIASNFGYEALGVLDTIMAEDRNAEQVPLYRFLRGAANYLVARYDDAEKDLALPALNGVDEAEFWRAAVLAETGRMGEAAPILAQHSGVFRPYPQALAFPLGVLLTRAAIALGDINEGSKYLEILAKENLSPTQIDQLAVLEGQLKQLAGDFAGALAAWEAASHGEHRPSVAKAVLLKTDTLVQLKKLDMKDAAEVLEGLRYTWRGDAFEFNLLRKLGRLYLDADDYRSGLRTLQTAIDNFKDMAEESQVPAEMAGAYTDLYLNDSADVMPPVQAIALFDEFNNLMPPGEQGDEMIRKLADRLAAVDLLDRAADLLKQQVQFRLQGVEKARVGARLATLQIVNRQPALAVEALRLSDGDNLPPELVDQRRILMARALVDQGLHTQALAHLENDESEKADLLRVEVFWQKQDWPNAAKVLRRLVRASGAVAGKPLSEEQAHYVLNYAVAMTLSGNERGMARIRSDFGAAMRGSEFKDAFDLISSPASIGLIDYRTVAGRVEQVSNFGKFMASYRERLKAGQLSQLN